MNLLERVLTLVRANLNTMVEKADDPEKVLKQLQLDMRNQLVQVKTQVATAIAESHKLQNRSKAKFAEAETWMHKAEQAILASRSRYEGKEKALDERETVLAARARELEDREAALNLREAQLEAEFEVREQRLEHREKAGAELEAQLSNRETDLSMYVAQLQENFDRRESEWWSKQLGTDTRQPPAA